MEITNEPGEHHEELIELNKRGAADVFSKGKRLHACLKGVREPSNLARHSAGDGAWIVQKCATTLRGGCSIDFRETSTVFSIWCPVSVYEAPSKAAGNDCPRPKFRFPKNTWAIALDDSKVRRKLLKRFLNLAGFADDRMIIQGESYEEISSFDDFALKFITNHPDAYFLLIVDENLDVSMDNGVTKQGTISGSRLVQSLRNHLLPEQECQVLALIRSANDSKHDIAMYKSRAHGFIPKAPLDRERIQENLDQLWKERFDSLESDEETERGSVVSCVSTQPSAVDTETSLDDQGLNLFENFRGVDELLKDGHP